MKELLVNPKFLNLIPPLSDEERAGLEESIMSEGCRDAIKVWRKTIIDGHNRYAICREHKIPFRAESVRISSKNDAILWIINNQLGRRNLTDAVRIGLLYDRADLLRAQAIGNKKKGKKTDCAPINVRKSIATEAGVSENTVYKYLTIREANDSDLLKKVEIGKLKIGTAYKMLDVTTRTVEVLYERDKPSDISSPHVEKLVYGNIQKLENMYKFIAKKISLLCGNKADIDAIKRYLQSQARVIAGYRIR